MSVVQNTCNSRHYHMIDTQNAASNDHIDTDCRNMFYQAFINYLSHIKYQSHQSLSFFYLLSNFLRLTSLLFLLLSWYSTFKTIINVKHYENCNLLRLRVTQNGLKFSFYFLFFSFSSMFLDGETEVIFILPASKLLIWYAVCFRAMSFRDK